MLYPLSGPTALAGLDEKHVYELLADMVNGKDPLIAWPFYWQELEGLKATDLPVPGTGVTCDATGQNAGVRAIIGQLQGGIYWTVGPFEMAAHEVLHPIPRWSDRKQGGRRVPEHEAVRVRVGIDVGGTFTDLVAVDPASGAVRSRKVLTTPEAPARGVLAGLQSLAPDAGSIAHGTTIVTNAIVEGRHARTALVTTRGFRDVLEIARQSRKELYRLDIAPRPRRSCPATSGSR